MVDEMFDRSIGLLMERRDLLERTAHHLLEKETLNETEIRELTSTLELSR